jgi:nitrate reductase (NAD(P)H)
LREQYSPQEITLLDHLNHESKNIASLTQNDGKQTSPVKQIVEHRDIAIDAQDVMTPDNWIPRSGNLVRRTGQHPFNAEPKLDLLFAAGLITPNGLHYVRNHAAVPRLYWDEFKLDVDRGQLVLSMDDILERFEPVNIPIAMACDGNRRGELNRIKKSKGFDWGSGAISCAYWKGALLVDILAEAGITSDKYPLNGKRRWVNFAGADSPSEGTYETSIPLSYALDPANDVLLAYQMNNSPLPADHGYPLRLIIPGWVGGRCVKWLKAVWLSDYENASYYHIWDNRVLPAFITEKDGEFANTMFNHPSTACNEQNLNSVIIHPGQSETLSIEDVLLKDTYRIEGYAYEGGGHEIQRVEVSLDQGKTWLYCLRHFTPAPIRNGNRFWAWIHWHIDVDSAHFVRSETIQVRAFNVFKNTQPEHPIWNVLGMMNNGWYTVRASTIIDKKTSKASVIFRHPFHQQDDDGWMRPSTENQLAAAQQESGTPDKHFTRAEIEKHNSKEDAWMIVNNKVYDVTSVLSWHPGGSATILANSGHLSVEVTSSFNAIHDEYAHKKLQECVIGRITDKAAKYMTQQAKASAEEAAKDDSSSKMLLQTKKWVPVTLTKRDKISEDTYTYTFQYTEKSPSNKQPERLGLGTCQHIQFGIHMLDKMLVRSYTPTRPIDTLDDDGTFELTIKTYYPDEHQPGGAFSNFLLQMPIGESVDVCGPTGEIEYLGQGTFDIEGSKQTYAKVNLVVGGSGLTPAYALIERVLRECESEGEIKGVLQIRVIDANKSEDDILLREKLDEAVTRSKGRIVITHVLSHPKDKDAWTKQKGLTGHVNADIIQENLFESGPESITFLCGPPGLIQKGVLPVLKDWGFKEGENVFGF